MPSTDDDEHELATPFTFAGDEARNAAARRIDVLTVKVQRRAGSATETAANVRGNSRAVSLDPVVVAFDIEARCATGSRLRSRNPWRWNPSNRLWQRPRSLALHGIGKGFPALSGGLCEA